MRCLQDLWTVSGASGGGGADVPDSVEDLRPGSGFVILRSNRMEAASVSEIKLMNNLVISWILVTWVMFHMTAALEALNSTVNEYIENVMYSKTVVSGHRQG